MDFESIPGAVPLFYEMQACNHANYRYFHDWQELSPEQQAMIIGHYLMERLVDNNLKDAENRQAKLSMLKAEGKRNGVR